MTGAPLSQPRPGTDADDGDDGDDDEDGDGYSDGYDDGCDDDGDGDDDGDDADDTPFRCQGVALENSPPQQRLHRSRRGSLQQSPARSYAFRSPSSKSLGEVPPPQDEHLLPGFGQNRRRVGDMDETHELNIRLAFPHENLWLVIGAQVYHPLGVLFLRP